MVEAARQRGEALQHILLSGPPGLGKTTLAYIIGNAMGVAVKTTSGPMIEKAGDLAGLLTNIERGGVLFIDEIHRLQPAIEEYLYPAMEDFKLDIVIDQGPSARSIRLNLRKVYPHRRDHARGHDQRAPSLAFWHDLPARLLRSPRSPDNSRTQRRLARGADRMSTARSKSRNAPAERHG